MITQPYADVPNWMTVVNFPDTVIDGQVFDGGSVPTDVRVGGIQVRAPRCLIRNCAIRNLSGIGIAIAPGGSATIEKNDITDTGMQGINFHDRTADYSGSKVVSNTLRRNGLDAITIGGIGKIYVYDNDIAECGYAGIYALTGSRNMEIESNFIHECFGGIDVSWTISGGRNAGTDLTSGVLITKNRVKLCGSGIGTGSNGTIICYNIVIDSGAANNPNWRAQPRPTGIGIVDACNCIVIGNISGNTGMVAMTQETGFIMKQVFTPPANNLIAHNNLRQNARYPIKGFYANAYSDGPLNGNTIEGNII